MKIPRKRLGRFKREQREKCDEIRRENVFFFNLYRNKTFTYTHTGEVTFLGHLSSTSLTSISSRSFVNAIHLLRIFIELRSPRIFVKISKKESISKRPSRGLN